MLPKEFLRLLRDYRHEHTTAEQFLEKLAFVDRIQSLRPRAARSKDLTL